MSVAKVSFTPTLQTYLRSLADRYGMSFADAVRHCVVRSIEQEDNGAAPEPTKRGRPPKAKQLSHTTVVERRIMPDGDSPAAIQATVAYDAERRGIALADPLAFVPTAADDIEDLQVRAAARAKGKVIRHPNGDYKRWEEYYQALWQDAVDGLVEIAWKAYQAAEVERATLYSKDEKLPFLADDPWQYTDNKCDHGMPNFMGVCAECGDFDDD